MIEPVIIGDATLYQGDCLDVLPTLGSVDAVVTDPPAGIGFMGKEWDKPDTFPLRDRGTLNGVPGEHSPHAHGRGFANGMTIDTASRGRAAFIAFLSSVARELLRIVKPGGYGLVWALPRTSHWTATALEDAGWEIRDRISHLFGSGFPKAKSCLKPACEDWWLVRRPGPKVLPLGIDECRVPTGEQLQGSTVRNDIRGGNFGNGHRPNPGDIAAYEQHPAGRWPANVTHDGSDEVLEAFAVAGERPSGSGVKSHVESQRFAGNAFGKARATKGDGREYVGDTGTAARFFYCAKASKSDRGDGNTHPTVKPTALMEWLVKLVAREGETVLDPFLGSGTTAVACQRTGRKAIGIERDPGYFETARRRVEESANEPSLFARQA